jgi:hypothetical protein
VVKWVFLLLGCAAAVFGADLTSATSLDEGYRQMYNLQFKDAHRTFHQFEQANPDDALGPASDAAAYLFSEFDRLHILQSEFFTDDQDFVRAHKLTPDAQVKRNFDAALDRARSLATPAGDASPDSDALFAEVLVHGLQSDYLALIEKRYLPALSDTKQARTLAEQLLSERPGYYDAYLAIGVENYLLSLKPAPVRWFLRVTGAQTDRQEGLEKLRLTAEKGHYLLPFARLLLAVAALRDKDHTAARKELGWLSEQFPDNHLFRAELAKIK